MSTHQLKKVFEEFRTSEEFFKSSTSIYAAMYFLLILCIVGDSIKVIIILNLFYFI